MTAKVVVVRGREGRLLRGHPWIYRSDLAEVSGSPEPGDVVEVLDGRGRLLGRGTISPRSQIAVRLLTREDEPVDRAFLRRRLEAAAALRRRTVRDTNACRLVHGEADGLPGLILDRYGDLLVLQALTAGMERLTPALVEAAADLFAPAAILERNDPPARDLDGLPRRKGFLLGSHPTRFWVAEGPVAARVDVLEGQKTGLFLDQRENRLLAGRLAHGRDVLDAFCYGGGFALHALHAGARAALALDIAPAAVALAAEAFFHNGFADRAEARTANGFDELRALDRAGRRFDLVVLDPPAFTKGRDAVAGALRGYKEINLRAMKLVRPGGILVTSSCSYHVDAEQFRALLADAAADARRQFRLREFRTQAADHPVLLAVRETQYLKCAILERVD
jgi:23S rRNA (cytosine1962-C5)-methyltransferase